MKVSIRIYPVGHGLWDWSVGRAGKSDSTGTASSYERAQEEAEAAAVRYEEEVTKAHTYLFDTQTRERTDLLKG